MTRLAAILFVLCLAAPVSGQEKIPGWYSGNELWQFCSPDSNTDACTAYIAGVSDTLGYAHPNHRSQVCVPENVTVGQLTAVVAKYLRDNPALRHNAAFELTFFAFKEAWPCD